jgi:hypothetical protein
MKHILALLLLASSLMPASGQTVSPQLEEIERKLKEYVISGDLNRQVADLNRDGKDDVIYSCHCSESYCIWVYLHLDGQYVEQIHEFFSECELWNIDGKMLLYLQEHHCCGESPFISNRVFEFNDTQAVIRENYVTVSPLYVEDRRQLTPPFYMEKPYPVKIVNDNYNLRFSPEIRVFKESNEDFFFTCENYTNIIAKIKGNAVAKVLSALVKADRTWLFVEIESDAIRDKCTNPISFGYKDQKLRGWISANYVEKMPDTAR